MDCRYAKAMDLNAKGKYSEAYKELNGISGYDSKKLKDGKAAISKAAYAEAESLFSRKDYKGAGELFVLISNNDGGYQDVPRYLPLTALWTIADYWNDKTSTSPPDWVWEYLPDKDLAKSLLSFKNTKDAIVSSDYLAFRFLEGNWAGGGCYFNIVPRNEEGGYRVYYSVPSGNLTNNIDYIGFQDGYFIGYRDGQRGSAKNIYRVTIVDENTMKLYSLANSQTYTMTRH